MKLFPKELWDVLKPKDRTLKPNAAQRKKADVDAETSDPTDGRAEPVERKADEDPDDPGPKEEDILDPDDDDARSEENLDDSFEDGDSDMGGDYDAERYFDGGDMDEADFEDAGEEGGYD